MNDILNLVTPFFATPRNYAETLKRIAGFVLYEVFFITLFLRDIPAINCLFHQIETYGHWGRLIANISHADSLNIAGLCIAILVATISHISQWHDRLSDAYRIRVTFDRREILIPLARAVGVQMNARRLRQLEVRRHELMLRVFYRYASSTKDGVLVDKHDTEQALASWSWFWALLEGAHYLLVGGVVALSLQYGWLGLTFLACGALFGTSAAAQYKVLKKRARPQIETILGNKAALADINDAFHAL